MNEKLNIGKTPEELAEEEAREMEAYAQWMMDAKPELAASPAKLRECSPEEIVEFEGLLEEFEAGHSLEALYALDDLTFEESHVHAIREPARKALIPINDKLNALRNETTISSEKYAELEGKYNRFARAMGMIRNNKVEHER